MHFMYFLYIEMHHAGESRGGHDMDKKAPSTYKRPGALTIGYDTNSVVSKFRTPDLWRINI